MTRATARHEESSGLWPVFAFLALVAAVLYARQLFFGQTFVLRDHLVYTWPERQILADALRAGRIPEWNDLVGFGTEFASSSANGVTYPPLWLVALFPLPWSMDAVVVLHVLLAGAGTALFARRLGADRLGCALAGAAFMCCGYVASIAPNKVFIGTAWIPWVAWAADRCAIAPSAANLRAAGVLAAVLAAQLLAGDPSSCITSALVAATVVLARSPRRARAFGWLAASYLPALLLASAGVLPGLALLPETTRGTLAPWDANLWSLHPWRLLELVWPGFLGTPIDARLNLAELVAASGKDLLEPSWSMSLFLGAPILALAVLAGRGSRERRGLWAGALILVLLAMGSRTPVEPILRAVFPPERIVRYPEKHVIGAICLLCALAGAGFCELTRAARTLPWIFGAALASLVVPLTLVSVLWPAVAQWLSGAGALMVPPVDVEGAMALSLRSGVVSVASAAMVTWFLFTSGRRRFSGALAVGVHVLHAAWEGWAITPVAPARILERVPKLLRAAPQHAAPPPRIFRPPAMDAAVAPEDQAVYRHETLLLDGAARFGYAAIPGFEGWRHRAEAEFWSRNARMPLQSFLSLFGVEAVALPTALRERVLPRERAPPQMLLADLQVAAAMEPSASAEVSWTLVQTEGVRPRAFVAPRWKWVRASSALETLVSPGRGQDPGLVVLTGEGAPSLPDRAALPLSPCSIVGYVPERIELDCDSPAGGYATLLDENAHGWTATVDGVSAPIVTADLLLRAVAVDKGPHRVEFRYRAPLLRTGAALSLGSWVLWLALLWRRRASDDSVAPSLAAEFAQAPSNERAAAHGRG